MIVGESTKLFLSRVVFMPRDLAPGRAILLRTTFVVLLLVTLIVILWLDREGLQDQADGTVSFGDVVYFTMVTITTVGYGDIVPITPRARWIDALVVTPVRIFFWIIFLGTAYQLALRQFTEVYRMAKLQSSLQQHVVVCGFGHTGRSATQELLARGTDPEKIAVIDPLDERIRAAVEVGVVAIRGDATQETVLNNAALGQAQAVIIAAGRDDTNALILLTVRHLTSKTQIVVSAKEEENVKLFRQGGAQVIVSPATFGGYMLAAAVSQRHLAEYLEDLLTAGGRVNLVEEPIREEDIGKTPQECLPDVLLRIYRQGSILSPWDLQKTDRLEKGDVVLFLKQANEKEEVR